MRTTLTLDDDVAAHLDRIRERRGGRLKDIVNEALPQGLLVLESGEPTDDDPYRVSPLPLGTPRLDVFDDIGEILAYAEGEGFP